LAGLEIPPPSCTASHFLTAVWMVSIRVPSNAMAVILDRSFENHQRQSYQNFLREALRAKRLGCSISGVLNVQIDATSMYKWTHPECTNGRYPKVGPGIRSRRRASSSG
jgi:hypothetical protein